MRRQPWVGEFVAMDRGFSGQPAPSRSRWNAWRDLVRNFLLSFSWRPTLFGKQFSRIEEAVAALNSRKHQGRRRMRSSAPVYNGTSAWPRLYPPRYAKSCAELGKGDSAPDSLYGITMRIFYRLIPNARSVSSSRALSAVTSSLLAFWNAEIASRVCGPSLPSIAPE